MFVTNVVSISHSISSRWSRHISEVNLHVKNKDILKLRA